MKTFVVVNPASADGVTGKRWLDIETRLRRSLGAEAAIGFTEKPMDAEHLARRALREGAQCVVAVGGDGTINEVVNGFFDGGHAVSPDACLGIIPRGTGGDFRRTFLWDDDLEAAFARLRSQATRQLDVGLVELTGPDGTPCRRYFANVCSFGVSGLVDQEVNRGSKRFGGKLSFMAASVRALLKYKDRRVQLSFDGGPFEEKEITTVAIANGRYFGGGMCVAPTADPTDGMFDVTMWSGYTLKDFALRSKSIYDGSHVKLAGTTQTRCKRMEARSDEEVLLDVDGEQPGRLPCTITLVPGALALKA